MSNDTAPSRDFTWLYTYSGVRFDVEDPRPENINIIDIAHALSLLCRYGGHSSRFYSVAEHSVLVSYLVPEEDALAGLLHDATEAYVVDLPRGVKNAIGYRYRMLEVAVWDAIVKQFGLASKLPESVKYADNAILLTEKKALMHPSVPEWLVGMGYEEPNVEIVGFTSRVAEAMFLQRFKQLTRAK